MGRSLDFMQRLSGCEAVGIRLKRGDDYPYFVLRGFPEDFVRTENHLCSYGTDGSALRDDIGNPVLDCMCGNILCGRFDPSKTFFSQHGSFWSNCTTELLASTTEADRQARTRNRCNGEGYESVALIPLRSGETTFGLIQLNDRRRDAFPPGSIARFERLADGLSYALAEKLAREDLRRSEARYESIIGTSMDGFWLSGTGPEGRIVEVNDAYCLMSGYPREAILGKRIIDFDAVEGSPANAEARIARIRKDGRDRFESRHRRADGSVFDVEISSFLQRDQACVLAFIRDISERKTGQAKIESLLLEKEILLKEVHHRVKNNLAAMESLLSIQAEHAKESSAAAILKAAQGRLRSMALLYDKLYRSENLGELPLRAYLPLLVDQVMAMFPSELEVRAETSVDDTILPAKTLSTIGILVNELITNAMKHAFRGRKGGVIAVGAASAGGLVTISVADDGIGMPEGVDIDSPSGLGLRLASLLANQLGASIRVERGGGTRVVMEFEPWPEYSPRLK